MDFRGMGQGQPAQSEAATENYLSALARRLENMGDHSLGITQTLASFRSNVLGEMDAANVPTANPAPSVRPVEALMTRIQSAVDLLAIRLADIDRQTQSIRQLG
jgi:hypothetical protein